MAKTLQLIVTSPSLVFFFLGFGNTLCSPSIPEVVHSQKNIDNTQEEVGEESHHAQYVLKPM